MRKFSAFASTLWLALASACLATPVSAFSVTPMVMEIELSGGQGTGRIVISNADSSDAIPIGLTVLKVELQADGSVTETDASSEILLFPPSAIVPAGEDQVIRVQYLGDTTAVAAQAYRIEIENLPVELDETASGVQFKTQFRALLFVAPPGAEPRVQFDDFSPIDEEGFVTVSVRNSGNHYAALAGGGLRLFNEAGDTFDMRGGEVASRVRGSIIFPNAERELRIDVPKGFEKLRRIEMLDN